MAKKDDLLGQINSAHADALKSVKFQDVAYEINDDTLAQLKQFMELPAIADAVVHLQIGEETKIASCLSIKTFATNVLSYVEVLDDLVTSFTNLVNKGDFKEEAVSFLSFDEFVNAQAEE